MSPRSCSARRAPARALIPVLACLCLAPLAPRAAGATGFLQINLVSDVQGQAQFTDPNLINPWGMSSSATSPWWVSDNGTGLSTLYRGTGDVQALVVSIPPAQSHPTGQVFNSTASDFKLGNGIKASFLFVTEEGTLAGWNGGLGTTGSVAAITPDAVYKGLALGASGGANYLYAANFAAGTIDVFNSTFQTANLAGHFLDPTLPAGYAPFNVQNLNGHLFVTYALQDGAKHDEVAGAGFGFVDEFGTDGQFIRRVASQGALDAPWGLALAPAGFGELAGDLLVGNFGDGRISAYDPATGAFLSQMQDGQGNTLGIDGLWGLGFGNGASAGPAGTLFFTAGPDAEAHGLFGSLSAIPEPHPFALLGLGLGGLALLRRRG